MYIRLNDTLRTRKSIVPWKDYLYYLLAGIRKLPIQSGNDVFRGLVATNFPVEKYHKGTRNLFLHAYIILGSHFVWPAFTSTSLLKETAKKFADEDGKPGTRFVFVIENASGHNVSIE